MEECEECQWGGLLQCQISFLSPSKQVILRLAYCGEEAQDPHSRKKIYSIVKDALLHALFQVSYIDAPCATSCKFKFIPSLQNLTDGDCECWDEGWDPYCLQFSVVLHSLTPSNTTDIKQEPREKWEEGNEDISLESNHLRVINKALPSEVRLLGWAPFTYHSSDKPLTCQYFFPRASLDIQSMHEAALGLTGTHQSSTKFGYMLNCLTVTPTCCLLVTINRTRPKCSFDTDEGETTDSDDVGLEGAMDLDKETRRVRVRKRKIKPKFESDQILQPCNHILGDDGYDMCVATMVGCLKKADALRIMWCLFCVGEGKCRPCDLEELLTTTSEDCIPISQVSDEALIISKPDTSSYLPYWSWDCGALRTTITQLQQSWTQHSVKAEALRHCLWSLEHTLLETSFGNTKGKDEMEEDEESELPRAQCDKLIGIRENLRQESPFFSCTSTYLMIEYMRPRLSRLAHPSTRLDVLKEVQNQLANNGWDLSLQRVRERWSELVDRYWREKRRREEDTDGEEEKEDWQYFEDMDNLLRSSSRAESQILPTPDSSTVKKPQKSDVADPSVANSSVTVPITIKAHMQADPKLPVASHSSSVSSSLIQSESSTALPLIIKSQMTSKASVGMKYEANSTPQLDSPSKSQTTFQPVCTVKTSMTSQTSGSSKSQPGFQPFSPIITRLFTHQDFSAKTQVPVQPTVVLKTQMTRQQFDDIKTKRVDELQNTVQVSGKRVSSFVSPVAIKTRIVTQPKHPFDKKLPVSVPQTRTKTLPMSRVSVTENTETPIIPSVSVKTEPGLPVKPITIRAQTHDMNNSSTLKTGKSKPFAIPQAVMSSVGQQKPNTTVLHHLGDSLFATQTGESILNMPSKSEMSEIFLEYHIQQGEKRLDQIEDEIIRMATCQKNHVENRQQREEVDALSVKALREIYYASTNLKNSLLSV